MAPLRVIDVYHSDTPSAPLLQACRVQREEEALPLGVDKSTQEQMRVLGLPTRFSSASCKSVSQSSTRSGRSHQVTSSLDEQCSRKLIDRVLSRGSRAPEKEANYGAHVPSADPQASKSIRLSISPDLAEASEHLGAGAFDGCGRSVLVASVQADVSTSHEVGAPCESRGCLAHERVGILDGAGPFDNKEAHLGPLSMSEGRCPRVDCKGKISSYESNQDAEDAISGPSRNQLESNDFVELTSGVDDHGPLKLEVEALPNVTIVKEALQDSEFHSVNHQSKFVHGTYGSLPAKQTTFERPEILLESSICQAIIHSPDTNDSVRDNVATFEVLEPMRRAKVTARCPASLKNDSLDFLEVMGSHSPTVFKYWDQRYLLFSKFDLGVKLDEVGWFSVTPEAIAKHQATRCRHGVVVDAFAGVGGNAIQFALAGHHVVAIDYDPKKIEYAHHNAMIYGVADRIDFVLADFFAVAPRLQADVVFLSPPWGGPNYLRETVYDILTMLQPKDGITLFRVAQRIASNIIFFLPRNVDINQLAELSKMSSSPCSCVVERNYLNRKLKAVTAYYGQFANMEET